MKAKQAKSPLIYAHRGASAICPENTMAAFRKAVELGADGIELDVHRSKDGHLVVIHDETVDRTGTGSGKVLDMNLAELQALDFGVRFEPRFAGERIPLLAEVLDLVKQSGIRLNIEIKNDEVEYPGIVPEVMALVLEKDVAPLILISSFRHATVQEAHETSPAIPGGILYDRPIPLSWRAARRWSARAIHPYFRSLTRLTVMRCHKLGLKVNVWTVDDARAIRRMVRWGVDAIITNRPDETAEIVRNCKHRR